MIRITKNTTNDVVFTLNEKTTLSGAKYLLAVYNNQSFETKVVRLTGDTSNNIIRYNSFPITEASTDDLDNGQVNLIAGTYDYSAYQTIGSDLSLTAATTTIVERGKLIVTGESNATGGTQIVVGEIDNDNTIYTIVE